MKLFTGWVMSAGLVLAAGAANAQMLAPYDIGRSPYAAVSDIDGPYAAMPPEAPRPCYGPMLLPAREVYTVVRENGFSPLGIPQQRGLFYTIAVIDRGGDDGRLVIDARDGRIVRFMPADRMGDNFNGELTRRYGPVGPLPPVSNIRGVPRPPASIPRVASRTPSVPMPKAAPLRAGEPKPLAAKPLPSRQPPAAIPAAAAAAIGGGAGQTGRGGNAAASRRARARRGKARRDADPADAGDAEGAGAGVGASRFPARRYPLRVDRRRAKKRPGLPGRFRIHDLRREQPRVRRRPSRPSRRRPAERPRWWS